MSPAPARVVTFLWRAAGSPETTSTSTFADVPASAYYAKAVAWAVEERHHGRHDRDGVCPDATCTRGQSVTFLYRALKGTAGSGAELSVMLHPAHSTPMRSTGRSRAIVTNGTSDTTFSPDASCTSRRSWTFLYRAYQGK